jgi:hypothetical protein
VSAPDTLLSPHAIADLRRLATSAPPGGAFVEVGVYKGGSAWHLYNIANKQRRSLYLYDTFCGTPHQGPDDGNPLGSFRDTSAQKVQELMPNACVVPGVFPGSIIPMPPIAFVHADADQYESTRNICRFLMPLMMQGGLMLFDDYGMPGCDGCTRAVDEVFNVSDELYNTPTCKKAFFIIQAR